MIVGCVDVLVIIPNASVNAFHPKIFRLSITVAVQLDRNFYFRYEWPVLDNATLKSPADAGAETTTVAIAFGSPFWIST